MRRVPCLWVVLMLGCSRPAPRPAPPPSPRTAGTTNVVSETLPAGSPAPTPSLRPRSMQTTQAPPLRRQAPPSRTLAVEPFTAEVAQRLGTAAGLPSRDTRAVAIAANGQVWVGTGSGVARWVEPGFAPVDDVPGPVERLTAVGDGVLALSAKGVYRVTEGASRRLAELPRELGQPRALRGGARVLLAGDRTLWGLDEEQGTFVRLEAPPLSERAEITDLDQGPGGELAAATSDGLYHARPGGLWVRVRPAQTPRWWDPHDVRAVGFDGEGRLWFASLQGVGVRDPEGTWRLYGPQDGLPWNRFTALACGPQGAWFGTTQGVVGFDGERWCYRQGGRWLPHDLVRDLAVGPEGSLWVATPAGLGRIARIPMTLAEKAARFEAELGLRHLRTEYGYVNSVLLAEPGDLAAWTQRDSDNDGLWTAMHGAAACFAWAATNDPAARERARRAFEALRFLSQVTQGGEHPAPPGFPARSILPADGPDPNRIDSPERDRRKQAERDKLWKVIEPRWPTSADGAWYWKCDTSSDELDGHFFFYAQYYDLVAEDEAERAEVRAVVTRIADHLLEHGLRLVDHDGYPTRWANYAPDSLNRDPDWFEERGLNSLSILSYLKVAEHVSGDARYRDAARRLIAEHGYAQNVLVPKIHRGPGSGNQSDDEMAFMSFYDLLLYESDPELRQIYARALRGYWDLVAPERNPFFAFVAAVGCGGAVAETPWGDEELTLEGSWLEDAVESLRRIPCDRVRWSVRNAHRLDVVALPGEEGRGHLRGGQTLPLDERPLVEHWNHDPWRLDDDGDGRILADANVYLLPYYMGRFHGFISEE